MRHFALKWFVSYSDVHTERTTGLEVFDTLKEARAFAEGRSGYITRQEWNGWQAQNSLYEFFGGFNPSATECRMIEAHDNATLL